jgi:hypothetical protein
MAHVYRAEIITDGIVNQGYTPSGLGVADNRFITHHKYYLMVSDTNGKFWSIEAALMSHTIGLGPSVEWQAQFRPRFWDGIPTLSVNSIPETWPLVFDHDGSGGYISIQTIAPDGDNGALFFNGGTLAIEKDELLNEMRFVTPGGTLTFPLADATNTMTNFNALDASPLLFRGHGHHMHIPFSEPVTQEATVKWHNARELTDGTPTFTIAMSTGDPGTWRPEVTTQEIDAFYAANTGGCGVGIALCEMDNAQEATRYRNKFTHVLADDTPTSRSVCNVWFRYRDLGIHHPPIAMDAALCPISGAIYTLRIEDHDHTKVKFAVTRDGGATFAEQDIATTGGADYAWPTIAVDPKGLVFASWQNTLDDTKQYWMISETFGQTWGTLHSRDNPSAVLHQSVSRLRFHPVMGFLIDVFMHVTAGAFKEISYDIAGAAGFSAPSAWATPPTIHALASDVWPAVSFTNKGEVAVHWSEGTHMRATSETYGATWAFADLGPGSACSQLALWHDAATGFHYVLCQDMMMGDLICLTSDNGGSYPIAGLTHTVVTGLDQQYAAVVTDHRGRIYALYQELSGGVYVVKCKRSENHGVIWVTP